MIFVVHGAVTIDGKALGDGEAWSGEGACPLTAGKDGVTIWRFELAASGSSSHPIKGALRSQEKLAAPLATVPQGELLLRQTITDLVSGSQPGTVMHLMADTRPFEGVGETDLVRGACWFGALDTMTRG